MATLKLNPAVAAARAARKAASAMPAPSTAPPTPPSASRVAFPAAQVKGLLKTEHTPIAGAPSAKAAKKKAMGDLRAKLKATWSHLFSRNDTPLAIGIRHDIAKHLSEDERRWLPAVLHQHVNRRAYQQALMQPGAHRVDLQGNLTPVSVEQAKHARALMEAST